MNNKTMSDWFALRPPSVYRGASLRRCPLKKLAQWIMDSMISGDLKAASQKCLAIAKAMEESKRRKPHDQAEPRDPLGVGTRIRFRKLLDAPANEDHPEIIYAVKGEMGTITGHGTREGYWVKSDAWASASFGASLDDFELADGSRR